MAAGMIEIRLGVVPTDRYGFGDRAATASARDRIRVRLDELHNSIGFSTVYIDDIISDGMVSSASQLQCVTDHLLLAGVDAIFLPHCNFGSEEIAGLIARAIGKPVLVWGELDEGPRKSFSDVTDRQCGLFATGKVLQRMGVPFSYIVNCHIDDPLFASGLERFIGAAATVKAMKGLRIGQIGTRPSPFLTMMANEAELLERFGIQVIPVCLAEIVEDAKDLLGSATQREQVEQFRERVSRFDCDDDSLAKMAALKIAIAAWAKKTSCRTVAIQCWSALQRSLGVGTCFVNSWLADEGLPVACETDIHGAITLVMLEAATLGRSKAFLADLTVRHPENPNAELLWHCGPFPYSLKDDDVEASVAKGGQANWRIRGGEMTIARFDGAKSRYSLALGQAKGVPGPETFGTYVWVEVADWPAWERRFVEGPYVHHVAVIHGSYKSTIEESLRYLPQIELDRLP